MERRLLMTNVLAMVLAGGEGRRLFPLTKERAKPAVPFGGRYRIIDFVLSNLVNSGVLKIKVLTQYKANSLIKHLQHNWNLAQRMGFYVDIVPPQMRLGKIWFRGTADAIYQNLNLIFDEQPDDVLVFSGDHVYVMDVSQMLEYHLLKRADITISVIPYPKSEASRFGLLKVNPDGRVVDFVEKPKDPAVIEEFTVPGEPDKVFVSMGNYAFQRDVLISILEQDAFKDSSHDFGKDIIPEAVSSGLRVFAYNFSENMVIGSKPYNVGYWRDVGTIRSYYEANMELLKEEPALNLYNSLWPIYPITTNLPPAKLLGSNIQIANSIVSEGSLINKRAAVKNSLIFPKVTIEEGVLVENSIIMDGAVLRRGAIVRNAIIDKGVIVEEKVEIGVDPKADEERFFVSEGIVVVQKGFRVTRDSRPKNYLNQPDYLYPKLTSQR